MPIDTVPCREPRLSMINAQRLQALIHFTRAGAPCTQRVLVCLLSTEESTMNGLPKDSGLFSQIMASLSTILAEASPEERARWSVDLMSSAHGDASPASHVRRTLGTAICHADRELNDLAARFDAELKAAERKTASGRIGWTRNQQQGPGLQVIGTD